MTEMLPDAIEALLMKETDDTCSAGVSGRDQYSKTVERGVQSLSTENKTETIC